MKPYTLITGASRGIGLALADRFAQRGAPLILAARSGQALRDQAQALRHRHGVPVQTIACDLGQQVGVNALIEGTAPYAVGGLVNNAGFGKGGDLLHQDMQELTGLMFLNMSALTQLTRHFLPQLVAHKGTLINVASQAAFQAMPHFAAYAASKAYVLHLTEALYQELEPKGVRVLAVCPGPVATDFWDRADIKPEDTHLQPGPIHQVVDATFDALKRRKPFVIPGFANRAMTFVQRFASRNLCVKMAGGLMGTPR
jgi:short-subunit dehydrogenase